MRKVVLAITIFALISPIFVQAQAAEKVNARLLPAVWFSALEAAPGDEVRVYAAVQNNSGMDFSSEVIFYVDGVEASRQSIDSKSGELSEVNTLWIAEEGSHTFQFKIEVSLPEGKELLSYETKEESFKVEKEITIEEVKEESVEIAKAIIAKVDEGALALKEKLEASKKPTVSMNSESETDSEAAPEVLGTQGAQLGFRDSAYNAGVDAAGFLLEKWIWTVSALGVLGLAWSFRV